MPVDKSKFRASNGKPFTQKLFIDLSYDPEVAVYTLREWDFTYEGVTYPSLKRLYLQAEDVLEYNFATQHLLSWDHWQQMCRNQLLLKHINQWREELALKIRSTAIRSIIDMSAEDKGFQAAKFLATKGWQTGAVGRPKKDTSEADRREEAALDKEFADDAERLWNQIKGNV